MIRPTIACALTLLLTAGCHSHGHGHDHHDDHGHPHAAGANDHHVEKGKRGRTRAHAHGHDHSAKAHDHDPSSKSHGHDHGPDGHTHTAAAEPVRSRAAVMPTLPATASADELQEQVDVAMEAHDFDRSLVLLKRLRRADPGNLQARLLLSDALVESGRLDEAETELQAVLNLKPCTASYLRAGYLLHLRGATEAGIGVLELAVEAAATKKTEAWARAELADLLWYSGKRAAAGANYEAAARLDANLARARVGQARVLAASGSLRRAAGILTKAASTPAHFSELAHWERALGHTVRSARALERARAMSVADSFHWGRQTAVALADHGRGSAWTVELARAELSRRANPHGWDAYAWALHGAGQSKQAYQASKKALAEGTQEPLLLYHAAVIAQAAGRTAEARRAYEQALALNPAFHVRFAARARAALKSLTRG